MLKEDTELWVSLGVHSGLKYWHENILQHLSKMWEEVLRSKHITTDKNRENFGEKKTFRTDQTTIRVLNAEF